jgi:hypothetical protein
MFSSMRRAIKKAKKSQEQMVMSCDEYIILRRYHTPIIDDLTGDPQNTSGNSFTDYKIPCQISEADDYKSKRDREWTGATFKGLRVMIVESNLMPTESDIIMIDYTDGWNPYKILSIKNMNSRIQIDVERIDRAIN